MSIVQSVSESEIDTNGEEHAEKELEIGNEQQISGPKSSGSGERSVNGEGLLYYLTPKWTPTSERLLEKAEQKILGCLKVPYESSFVAIDNGNNKIRTLTFNPTNSTKTPYVLIHGFASAVGLWALNFEALSADRPLYAFDILGFGRSSRPKFPVGAEAAEAEFVRSIEEWRKAVGIEQMILVGHSMGGFLSTAYSLQHPDRVKHLVLLDPWGFMKREPVEDGAQRPLMFRVIGALVWSFNPLSTIRAAGPFGPWLIRWARAGTVAKKFSSLFDDDRVAQYIYHCNAQPPSGEVGFKAMSLQLGWAVNPMVDRIGELPPDIPISMIYGSRTWMDMSAAKIVKRLRQNSRVDFKIIKGTDHHVYADKTSMVNDTVNELCKDIF